MAAEGGGRSVFLSPCYKQGPPGEWSQAPVEAERVLSSHFL